MTDRSDEPKRVPLGEYDSLIAAYRSGQVTEKQWTAHLEDQVFASYYQGAERARQRGPQPTA